MARSTTCALDRLRQSASARRRSGVARRPGDALFLVPARRALVDEGADAFACLVRQHVLDHDARGIVIGLAERHLDLAVEGFLADLDDAAGLAGDEARELD